MAEDAKLCAKTRKIVVGCWFDISRVRVRVTRGVIHLDGTIKRLGEDPKDPESNAPFLDKLDEQLRRLPDSPRLCYAFDNWRQERSGFWRFIGKKVRGDKKH